MPIKMHSNMRQSFSAFALKAFGSVFALFVLTLSSVHAAGLGKLTVLSSLGQPLRAEIELTSVAKDEVDSIVVKLASFDDYKKANLEFTSALHTLRFAVDKRGARHVVRVTSSQALNEPFVGMLLELRSNSGRLTREYTFLLDPADLRSSTPAVAVSPARVPPVAASRPVAEPVKSEAAKSPDEIRARAQAIKARGAAEKTDAKPETKAGAKGKAKAEKESAAQHKIKKGDTLAVIAKKYKHEEVTLEQMLVSIYQTNPEAFVGKNMNRIRVGKVLTVPDVEAASGVTKSEARKVIVAQASDFASYRNKLAGQAAQAAPKQSDDSTQAAGGKIATKVEEKTTPAKQAQDKLKLSKASGKTAGGKSPIGAAGAEDKAAKDKAAAEERARVKELEKNVSDLQNIIDMKNKQLAEKQKLAADVAAAKQAADVAAAKQAADAAAAKQAADAVAAKQAADAAAAKQAATSAPVPATASVPPVVASVPAVPAVSVKPPVKRVAPPPPPPPAPSFFDEMLGNPVMLGGVGVALLLIVLLAIRSRSKKKSQTPVAGSFVTENNEVPNSLFGSAGGQSVDTNNSIFNSGFTPSASLLDANEVDPVAEADVYIAYGREAQAVEILKEALRSHPERNALRIKLLEIYASQKDINAFDLLAGELYGLTRGEGEEWVYAAGLGIAIDPTNPLYAGGDMSEELLERPTSLQGSMTQPAPDLDPEVLLEKPRKQDGEMQAHEFVQPTREQIETPDFPLDLAEVAPHVEKIAPNPEPLNFDLNLPTPKVAEVKTPDVPATLDFDLGDFGIKKAEPAAPIATTGVSVSEVSPLEFDQMAGLQMQAAAAATQETDFAAQLAIADRELEAIGKVEPYTPVAQEPMKTPDLEPAKPTTPEPVSFDFGTVDLELDTPAEKSSSKSVAARSGSAEMDTKIELAAAYLGIGDKEGARELLEEVIQDGTPEQVEKARQSLAKIS